MCEPLSRLSPVIRHMEGAEAHDEGRSLSLASLAPRDAYRLLVSIVVPRPIAWVSSLSEGGVPNLAPFSFFTVVGDNPPTIMVSIGQRRGGLTKDTLRNVAATGEFVVNIVDMALVEQMNLTSGEWPVDVDEFALAGIERVPSIVVKPARVLGAPVALEARLTQVVPVEGTTSTMILGRVEHVHIRAGLLGADGLVDAAQLGAVARLGGDGYTHVESTFLLPRPRV